MLSSRKLTKLSNKSIKKYATDASKHTDTSKLFIAVSDLEEKYNIKLKSFPRITVIGLQSSGKSSVIEGICGESILPKAMKISTLKPVHLTTIRSQTKKFKIGDREFFTDIEAAQEVDRLNNNGHITKINVTIWSPDVYNANLIDLPGLFVVASKEHADFPKKIKNMCETYLQDANNIPVIVHAAPSDPATNQAIKLLDKFGRNEQALGVVTKVDMLEKENKGFIKELLNGDAYKLGYGYCAVTLRSEKDIEARKTINDKIKEETEFFTRFKLRPSGVIQLRKMISDIQFSKIKDQIPNLVMDIDTQIADLKVSQSFMYNLVNNDQKKLASKLRMMIEKLVGSSLERAEFEEKLKQEFKIVIGKYMGETLNSIKKNHIPKFSNTTVNSYITSFNVAHKTNPNDYVVDGIKELFSYGLVSPIPIDNYTIKNTFDREIGLATNVPTIDIFIDDPLGKKRAQWNRHLNSYFSRLLGDDNIHTIIHDITEKLLLEYIYDDPEGYDDLTKKFAEYMVKEIGNEAYESKIKYSITATLNLEKRPQVSIFEITRYISLMYPSYFTYHGEFLESLLREKRKFKLEVYSDEWNEAYLRVVSDKLTENSYRNVAVNLLDRMVEKLLELCMDLFNKESAIKEQNKINEKVTKLTEIRTIVASYTNKNIE